MSGIIPFLNLIFLCQPSSDITRPQGATYSSHQAYALYGFVPSNFLVQGNQGGQPQNQRAAAQHKHF